jgi:glycosyltransferase involved in cell wall biosynthesis
MSLKRFKVLTICSWYPNDLKPTLGNFVQKHAESIAFYNDVVALAIFPSIEDKSIRIQENKSNLLHEIVIYYPKIATGFKPFRLVKNYFSHRRAFKKGYQRVFELIGKPEIVHLNIVYPLGIWALWLKWRYKIPYIITENSSGFHVDSDHAYPSPILKLSKLVIRNAAFVLPVSENLMNSMRKLSPKSRFGTVSNVVDEHLFTETPNFIQDEVRLIHISTGVDEIKNLSGMIRVMNALKSDYSKVKLAIVSDGDIEYAKGLAKSLNVESVTFYSTKTTAEIAQMIQNSHALLQFSNYENFPCVIAEAMMCGKPILSSNVNGIPEHVNEINGMLVNRGDEEALKKAIISFVKAPEKFKSSAIRAYAMKHFSYSEVGKRFTEIYAEVLGVERK